jgi:hypothetical protein
VEVKPATRVQVVVNGAFTPSFFTAINSGVATLQVKGISTKTAKLQNGGYVSIRQSVGDSSLLQILTPF